jgi:membrane-associated phospholipid phosphatase
MTDAVLRKARSWSRLQVWCGSLAVTAAAVVISVVYLDRPISRLAERMLPVGDFTSTPSFFDPLVLLVFGLFLLRRIAARPFGKADVVCLLGAASLILADIVKGELKYLFGRTWPKYEFPSFIHDGAYGFNPFHPEHAYQSFPSGHVAAVCALLSVLWTFYPRLRPVYALAGVGLAAGLVATNYHFLADVIAGAFLGASIGLLVISAWERWDRIPISNTP